MRPDCLPNPHDPKAEELSLIARIEHLEALFGKQGAHVPFIPLSQRRTVSIEEACRLVPVGKTRLYAWIKKGRVRSIKVGKSRRIVLETLPGFSSEAAA